MNLTDKQLENITKEANSKKFLKDCVPNVIWPRTLSKSEVLRSLEATKRKGYICNPEEIFEEIERLFEVDHKISAIENKEYDLIIIPRKKLQALKAKCLGYIKEAKDGK